jgi:hypothetical protein
MLGKAHLGEEGWFLLLDQAYTSRVYTQALKHPAQKNNEGFPYPRCGARKA